MDSKDNAKSTVERKNQHLRIVVDHDVTHGEPNLLEDVRLIHQALPELDFDKLDLTTGFFGKQLKAPLMITSMTGGADFAETMNRGLAEVAEKYGIAFALGSQRVMLRHPDVTDHFAVRRQIPTGVLLGNIGAVQLEEYPLETIVAVVEKIEADGICVHLNPAQELMQDEGHRNFSGMLDQISRLVDRLDGRVLVKETGAGLSWETLKKLASIGVAYIDVSGSGGTSWTKVESYRAIQPMLRKAGGTFSDWGIPTAVCVLAARSVLPKQTCVVASGGIKTGLDCARGISLGADLAGFARPILLAYMESGIEGASAFVEQILYELKATMLLTGTRNVQALQRAPRIYTGKLREWLAEFERVWREQETV